MSYVYTVNMVGGVGKLSLSSGEIIIATMLYPADQRV